MNISIDVSSTEAVNIFNTPSNVTLIDRETILRYEYQAVAEAIRSVAGIEVLQSNIDRNIITSRGVLQNYYTNKVLIMINGISTWQPIYGSGISALWNKRLYGCSKHRAQRSIYQRSKCKIASG